jgi:hypothetical protein
MINLRSRRWRLPGIRAEDGSVGPLQEIEPSPATSQLRLGLPSAMPSSKITQLQEKRTTSVGENPTLQKQIDQQPCSVMDGDDEPIRSSTPREQNRTGNGRTTRLNKINLQGRRRRLTGVWRICRSTAGIRAFAGDERALPELPCPGLLPKREKGNGEMSGRGKKIP